MIVCLLGAVIAQNHRLRVAYSAQRNCISLFNKQDMATFEGDTNVPAFEDVDEEFVVSSEPYLYEPEYTDEELIEMDAQKGKLLLLQFLNAH